MFEHFEGADDSQVGNHCSTITVLGKPSLLSAGQVVILESESRMEHTQC